MDAKPSPFVEENPPKDETKTTKQAEPKSRPANQKKKPASAGRPSKKAKRQEDLEQVVNMIGTAVMLSDMEAGSIIINGSEDFAKAWADLADKNAKVAQAIDALFTAGAYTQVTVATLAIVVPLLQHYKLLPGGFFNPLGGASADQTT